MGTVREISFCKKADGHFVLSWYNEKSEQCCRTFESSEQASAALSRLFSLGGE